MKQKDMFKAVVTLLIGTALVFGTSEGLKTIAHEKETEKVNELCKVLLPGAESFAEEEYTGEDTNIKQVFKSNKGYVIKTVVSGYADEITLYTGVDNGGSITGLTITDMAETFGLGRRALSDMSFLSQFVGTKGEAAIGEGIDALSGATVTSKSVAKAVNSASAFVTGADVASGATEWGG